MVRIGLAERCPIVCRGLKNMFRDFPDLRLHGEAAEPRQILQLLAKNGLQVLIFEIQLCADPAGVDLLASIHRQFPRTPVLIYTYDAREELAVRALKAGASGYLHKFSPESEIISAIRKVASGATYLSPALAERLALQQLSGAPPQEPHEGLSVQERRVFDGLAAGKTQKEIATDMSVSPKTITSYRGRILDKMSLRSNAEIVRYSVEHFVP